VAQTVTSVVSEEKTKTESADLKSLGFRAHVRCGRDAVSLQTGQNVMSEGRPSEDSSREI
jgi:hypothetical protein